MLSSQNTRLGCNVYSDPNNASMELSVQKILAPYSQESVLPEMSVL